MIRCGLNEGVVSHTYEIGIWNPAKETLISKTLKTNSIYWIKTQNSHGKATCSIKLSNKLGRELSFSNKRSQNFTKKQGINLYDIHSDIHFIIEIRLSHDVSPSWIMIKVNCVQIFSFLSPGTRSSASIFIAFVAIRWNYVNDAKINVSISEIIKARNWIVSGNWERVKNWGRLSQMNIANNWITRGRIPNREECARARIKRFSVFYAPLYLVLCISNSWERESPFRINEDRAVTAYVRAHIYTHVRTRWSTSLVEKDVTVQPINITIASLSRRRSRVAARSSDLIIRLCTALIIALTVMCACS